MALSKLTDTIWEGQIDEVEVFVRRALSQSEIQAISARLRQRGQVQIYVLETSEFSHSVYP